MKALLEEHIAPDIVKYELLPFLIISEEEVKQNYGAVLTEFRRCVSVSEMGHFPIFEIIPSFKNRVTDKRRQREQACFVIGGFSFGVLVMLTMIGLLIYGGVTS